MGNIKTQNKNVICKKCFSTFHPRCFSKVKVDNEFCKLCISKELPFHFFNYEQEFLGHVGNIDILNTQNVFTVVDNPDNLYECLKNKGLHFLHLNAQSMFRKLPQFQYIADKYNPAIIAITETWLDDSYTNNSIKIEGYNLIRRDRQAHAGGVCMYIRENLPYNPREDLQNNEVEDLWIEILLPHTKPIFIGTFYRAPKNLNATNCINETISKLPLECDTILLGDFNYCLLKNNHKFAQVLHTSGYKQLINEPTRITNTTESLIDHIYVNNVEKISQSGVIQTGISDHFITFCTMKTTRNTIGKHTTKNIRQMKNYTKETYNEKLSECDWSHVTNIKDDVNLALEKFITILMQAINSVAPKKEIRIKGRTKPWIDSEILDAMRDRDIAKLNAIRNRSNKELTEKYNEKRNKVINMCKNAKAKHFSNKVDENKDNPKKLWQQFKTLGYSSKNLEKSHIVLNIDDEKCYDSDKVAEELNNYFLTVASNLKSKIPDSNKIFDVDSQNFKDYYKNQGITPKSCKPITVSEDFIYKELKSLNPSKATGIDDINPIFLRDGAELIKGAVTHIINLSIKTNVVPEMFKYAIVKPLHKKNSRLEVGNYRPVSILCTLSKILEKSIFNQMNEFLVKNNILYDFQSGFRGSYSTDTCLINLMDHIKLLNSKNMFAGMVLMDLQKAFDTVDHNILCKKLEAMGLDFTEWVKSYLNERKQVVEANGAKSSEGIVTCGVPQGSILGPLLFLCYVNDMPMSVKCKLLLYADDSALIVSGKDPKEIARDLSRELESCKQWLIDNKLSLHLGKTEAILFGSKRKLNKVESFDVKCGDININNVNSVKYLGVQIDNTLSGENIVMNIIKKCNSRLKFLYRHKDMLDFCSRKTLCTALIQCHFDYSCSSWYPGLGKTLKDKLQVAQNKMIRFILDLDNRAHIGHKEFKKAGFLDVSSRVSQLKLGHAFKVNKKTCPEYLRFNFQKLNENAERIATRAKAHNFHVPKIDPKTFAYSTIKDWNNLPNDIKMTNSLKTFKDKVVKHFGERMKNQLI